MGALIEAGADLAGLTALLVALGAAYLLTAIVEAIDASVPNPSIFGWKPLNFIHSALAATAGALHTAAHDLEQIGARLFSGLQQALELLVGVPLVLMLAIEKALSYMWTRALEPRVHAIESTFEKEAAKASAAATEAGSSAAGAIGKAEAYADAIGTKTLESAKSYAHTQAAAVMSTLTKRIDAIVDSTIPTTIANDLKAGGSIAHAIANAVGAEASRVPGEIAATIATDLRAGGAIARAIADKVAAVAGLNAADVDGIIARDLAAGGSIARAIADKVAGVTGGVGVSIDDVHAAVGAAISAGLAAGGSIEGAIDGAISDAIAGLGNIPVPSTGDIATAVAGLTAAVAGIEAISFIGRLECRGKVGQICSTDANAWGGLLAGIAAIGVGFTLTDVVRAALALVGDVDKLLAEVGDVAASEVDAVGKAIGQAALAIAA